MWSAKERGRRGGRGRGSVIEGGDRMVSVVTYHSCVSIHAQSPWSADLCDSITRTSSDKIDEM
jgi:hypothetical protein